MKKYLTFALIAILLTSSLVGCSSKKEVEELKTKVEELEQQVSSLTAEPVRPEYLMPEDEFKQLGHDILADVMMQLADYDIDNPAEGDFIRLDLFPNSELDSSEKMVGEYNLFVGYFSSDTIKSDNYFPNIIDINLINCKEEDIEMVINEYKLNKSYNNEVVSSSGSFVYRIAALDEVTLEKIQSIMEAYFANKL